MKAVILERYVMHEGDLDWSGVKALIPDTTSYVRTAYEEIAPRIGDAEVVFLNKCRMDEAILAQCPNLKFVGIIATGTDNLDLDACRRHGVAVANVPGYSTYSVAQMTFSLLLAIVQCAERYDRAVKDGLWQLDIPAGYACCPRGSCTARPSASTATAASGADGPHRQSIRDAGTRLHPDRPAGICRRRCGVRGVCRPAEGERRPQPPLPGHAPDAGAHRCGGAGADEARCHPAEHRARCPCGRSSGHGGAPQRAAGFYGADAFATEPLPADSPLRKEPHAILTPHIAWTTKEALQNLMDITTRNLRTFLDGNGEHIVNR